MSFDSGFRGIANGAIQATYNDQPAVAVPGMLFSSSDYNLVDAYHVSEANGVGVGRGVVFVSLTDAINISLPPDSVALPVVGSALANFAGFIVFDEGMQSNENGVPGWGFGRMAQVLRAQRAGGRIWLLAQEAVVLASSTLNLVTVAGTTNGVDYAPGDICPTALGGAGFGTSIDLSSIGKYKTAGAAGSLVLVELNV